VESRIYGMFTTERKNLLKIRNWILSVLSIIAIIVITVFIFDRFIAGISIWNFSIFKSKKESTYTIAEEIGDLFLLNTSEYRMKLIFPFDFVDQNYNWWVVKEIYDEGSDVPEYLKNELTIYQSCRNAGFDPALDIYDFIILTSVVKAGINISGTIFENPLLFPDTKINDYIKIEKSGEDKKNISLHIPKVEITDYYIEDRKPENDNFPDAQLTPGQWRDLVTFLNPLILDKVVKLGILENARENSEQLIEKVLKEGGFSEVNFTGQDL
jgi:hypothetical protein